MFAVRQVIIGKIPVKKAKTTMYSTKGVDSVATITELRSKTSELVKHAKEINKGILVQKNNEPYAVLISYDLYLDLLEQADRLDEEE